VIGIEELWNISTLAIYIDDVVRVFDIPLTTYNIVHERSTV
jgi:hypothetical protein